MTSKTVMTSRQECIALDEMLSMDKALREEQSKLLKICAELSEFIQAHG
jgi:hypothetical protein